MGIFDFLKKKTCTPNTYTSSCENFFSPIRGCVKDISETPDTHFSKMEHGNGVVIFPEDNKVYAPVDCEIIFVFPDHHAIGMKTESNIEFVIQVGIDTASLHGEGFNVHVADGQQMKKGELLMEFDLNLLQEKATSTASPLIITDLANDKSIKEKFFGELTNSDIVFTV